MDNLEKYLGTRNSEFQLGTRNYLRHLPGPDSDLGKISRFRLGVWKNSRFSTRKNSKFPGSDFLVPEVSCLILGFFTIFPTISAGQSPEFGLLVENLPLVSGRDNGVVVVGPRLHDYSYLQTIPRTWCLPFKSTIFYLKDMHFKCVYTKNRPSWGIN